MVSNMGKLFTRLQGVLKVTFIIKNTRKQSSTPLSDSSLDNSVVETMPFFAKTPLKAVYTIDPGMYLWSTLRTSLNQTHCLLGNSYSNLLAVIFSQNINENSSLFDTRRHQFFN